MNIHIESMCTYTHNLFNYYSMSACINQINICAYFYENYNKLLSTHFFSCRWLDYGKDNGSLLTLGAH